MGTDQPTPPTQRQQRLDRGICQTTQTADSAIAMCHRQGKTAVYLSDDETCIAEHPPHGPIKRSPLINARSR